MCRMKENRIRNFLKANHLRQVDIVEYLGISRPYMSQVTNGAANLSPENLERLINNDKGWSVEALTSDEPEPQDEATELAVLRERVKYLEMIVDEKERTIQLLSPQRPSENK